ncbi:MAG: antibiotic biosynthesis monooxygenase [Candidatus Andersenbacteria bacterium]|nr:antibiotic biosynthesis monooxygenase [Candidatus Andersenbacteria bacterium]
MYIQMTHLLIPLGKQDDVREFVEDQYFKNIEGHEGFIMAHLLEAIDDPLVFQIITYWENQQAIEKARTTGSLQKTTHLLAATIPEVRIQRQAYIVTVSVDDNTSLSTRD